MALDDEHLELADHHHQDEETSHESIITPGVTLQQILDSFSESDDAEYQSLVTAMVQDAGGDDDNETENETNSEDKYLNHFSYLEKPLYDLLERLELGDVAANPFEGFDRDSPTVLVGSGLYLVSEKLVEIFTKVFTKYGDISGKVLILLKCRCP